MLVNMNDILAQPGDNSYAVPCLNTPSLEILRAAVDAAEELSRPIIVAHAPAHDKFMPLECIGPLMVEYAKRASVPICVHLDHGTSYHDVLRAVRCGFSSVMYDCSTLPYAENAQRLQSLSREMHKLGISVEAELGAMLQNFDCNAETALPTSDAYTDPTQAGEFARFTGVDALAVCIGTSHGFYTAEPRLDLQRLEEIRSACDCRLVMHGSSGVPLESIQAAIKGGIAKINYYTYLSISASAEIAALLEEKQNKAYYHEIEALAYPIFKAHAKQVIEDFVIAK